MSRLEQIERDQKLKELMLFDQQDILWLYKNYKNLLKNYKNSYIAIRRQEVVDHDKNVQELFARLNRKFADTHDILIYYIAPKKIKFLF
jgi:hypothetical protein